MDRGLRDYKFFCFNGKVKCFKVDFDRFVNHRANYYDLDCGLLPFGEASYPPNPTKKLKMPENINDMVAIAEKLSKGLPFIRVDLYNVSGRIYFGELTFFPASGFGQFVPRSGDVFLGEALKLPLSYSQNY